MVSIAQKISSEISEISFNALPSDSVYAAKRCLLDGLGAMLAGAFTKEAQLVLQAAKKWGSQGSCLVVGSEQRLSAPHAALVNGTAAHAQELDDFGCAGHTGAVVIPAILSAAELSPITGEELLAAIVVGYEIGARIIDALGGYGSHTRLGWHSTGTVGTFSAAVAAGRVLKFCPKQMLHSLGLAGSYLGGIWAFNKDGAMSKRLHAGKAAQTGLEAALLAKEGFTGPAFIFEPDIWGSYFSTYGDVHSEPKILVDRIGENWEGILRTGFKPYASCRDIHHALDAAFELKRENIIHPDDIVQIQVRGSEQMVQMVGKKEVHNKVDAQLSAPFSLGLAFVVGRAGVDEYESAYINDPEIQMFASRIEMVPDQQITPGGEVELKVCLRDGRELCKTIVYARGDSKHNPLSDQELQTKFAELGIRILSEKRIQELIRLVWSLESQGSSHSLIKTLSHASRRYRDSL